MTEPKKKKWINFWWIWISFSALNSSCKTDAEIKYEQYVISGKSLYEANCANCHGKDGTGLRELYPALSGSSRLEDIGYLSCIIKKGTSGKEVNMPANKQLYDIDVAQIITYMNEQWGSKKQITETHEVKIAICK